MIEKEVLERIEGLIIKGEKSLEILHEVSYLDCVDDEKFSEWQTQVQTLLFDLLPKDHPYIIGFSTNVTEKYPEHVKSGIGILKALHEDVKNGYLQKIENLIQADVFSDFLEMAEYLLRNKYKDPAASLTGAVLEDSLRKICVSKAVPVKKKENISSLNQKLVDAQIYNQLVRKEVEVWNEIRNNADHGHFDQYSEQQVENMISNVRSFIISYLE